MGYRPPEQELEDSIDKILEGFDTFEDRANERIRHYDEWADDHIETLVGLLRKMSKMKHKLVKLKDETW